MNKKFEIDNAKFQDRILVTEEFAEMVMTWRKLLEDETKRFVAEFFVGVEEES